MFGGQMVPRSFDGGVVIDRVAAPGHGWLHPCWWGRCWSCPRRGHWLCRDPRTDQSRRGRRVCRACSMDFLWLHETLAPVIRHHIDDDPAAVEVFEASQMGEPSSVASLYRRPMPFWDAGLENMAPAFQGHRQRHARIRRRAILAFCRQRRV